MFSGIKRLIGNITVEVKNNEVFIEGIKAEFLARDIKRFWGSNKINTHLFTQVNRYSLSFPSFFLPDVLYTLDVMTQKASLKVPVRTLVRIKDLLLEQTWLANTLVEQHSKTDYARLKDMTLTPLDFQDEFFKIYDQCTGQYGLNGYLLAAAAGSGKSFSALALMHCLHVDRVIVVCPKNAVSRVWEENLLRVFKKSPTYWLSTGTAAFTGKEQFIVCHYEAQEKVLAMAKRFAGEDVGVILDESHNLNTTGTLRTNLFLQLCAEVNSREVLWLSGTPIKALSSEAIPLLRCIDPLFTEDVERRFKKIFNDDRVKSIEILKNRMGLVSFKVEKSALGLQPPIFTPVPIKIPNGSAYTLKNVKITMQAFVEERVAYYRERSREDNRLFEKGLSHYEEGLRNPEDKRAYQAYRKDLEAVIKGQGAFDVADEMLACNRFELNKVLPTLPSDIRATWRDVRSVIKYLHLKIQGECLGRILGGLRIQCHVDMVNSIDFEAICQSTAKKTVVFTSYVAVLEKCKARLEQLGMKALFVYGKTNSSLNTIIQQFQQDPDANPLAATYDSLSTAVPLVMADTMILINAPFRDYVLTQAVSRIHRLDSNTQTNVYSVSLDTGEEPNLSTRSLDILAWSQNAVEQIMGIKAPFVLKNEHQAYSAALEGYDETPLARDKAAPKYLSW